MKPMFSLKSMLKRQHVFNVDKRDSTHVLGLSLRGLAQLTRMTWTGNDDNEDRDTKLYRSLLQVVSLLRDGVLMVTVVFRGLYPSFILFMDFPPSSFCIFSFNASRCMFPASCFLKVYLYINTCPPCPQLPFACSPSLLPFPRLLCHSPSPFHLTCPVLRRKGLWWYQLVSSLPFQPHWKRAELTRTCMFDGVSCRTSLSVFTFNLYGCMVSVMLNSCWY